MNKLTTLLGASHYSRLEKQAGKRVGLIVGSFDILHLGHINLFRYAKRKVDVLIVGLDNDKTIRLVKGNNRPINNFQMRGILLSDLVTVDKIFEIRTVSHHDSEEAFENYKEIVNKISPTHIFTHKVCDRHWLKKEKIARQLGIAFLLDKSKRVTNSGTILKKIASEL